MPDAPHDKSNRGDRQISKLDRADQICDAFERECLDGQEPRLEDYLTHVPEVEREGVRRELEVIQLEYDQRRSASSRTPDDHETVRVRRPPATRRDNKQPARIGRYRIERLLGQGGFGNVYLARDQQLGRLVAIKVPHAELVTIAGSSEMYLSEARTVAHLDHPHIVPVYDVGANASCPCYVVSKYIEGCNLASEIKADRPGFIKAAELVATVAEALHYAHTQGVVHRDVKPGNILIDGDGRPHVVDFGLALREENIGTGPTYLGTPAYMSPEQAGGEGHRVDARSDIFSLGVVLYELLAGCRPFSGDTETEVLEQLKRCEPRPLRHIDERIPAELERICNKATAIRAKERFPSALEFADDLRYFLTAQVMPIADASTDRDRAGLAVTTAKTTARAAVGPDHSAIPRTWIVPKGLRSFDAHDAEFFFDLLPGPRDREGLPDSVRFWKSRIEESDPGNTFAVGVIYGPSGCGKTSLVKAGLLPRLSDEVISVYVEALPDQTEPRLLRALRTQCSAVRTLTSLKETLASLRRGQGIPSGKKVLIVLDQFEQWLHAKREEDTSELVQALRQCDGSRVQCIVMVRDDFWLPAARFMQELDLQLLDGQNSAAVDLFPIRHAEKVLTCFGRAFGALPEDVEDVSKAQRDFVTQTVAGLSEEGKVNTVRLALFADMMKSKPWTSASLRQIGGVKGVGVTFLEETFGRQSSLPHHRQHEQAARRLLMSLLPESGVDIKAEAKSYDELLEASGYADNGNDFEVLINILDHELRLITPMNPDDVEPTDESGLITEVGQKYYQLTHDYLVPSLRGWLTVKQRETRKGRADLRLAERAAIWESKPENRHLPSWWEHADIRLLTDKRCWTPTQQKMMNKAGRTHGLRAILVAMLLGAFILAGFGARNAFREQRLRTAAEIQEKGNSTRAEELVHSLLNAEITQVPVVVSDLEDVREWADPLLKARLAEANAGSPQKLHLALALLPVDKHQINFLSEQLSTCTITQFPVLRNTLVPYRQQFSERLWELAENSSQDSPRRFQAAAALAAFAPNDQRWEKIAHFVATYLTDSSKTVSFGRWLEYFQPASHQLTSALKVIAIDSDRLDHQRESAALALADYHQEAPDSLTDLILVTEKVAVFKTLVDAVRPNATAVKQRLIAAASAELPPDASIAQRDAHWRRRSMAAVTLVHLGYGDEIWPMLEFTADPSLRSFMIHHLGEYEVDATTLAERLEIETDISIRRALIQSLGRLDATRIPALDRRRIAESLQATYTDEQDPGIHGSAAYALRQWGLTVPEIDESALPAERRQRLAEITRKIDDIHRRKGIFERNELAEQQFAWERKLQSQIIELPAILSDGLISHFSFDETEGNQARGTVKNEPPASYQGQGQPEWVSGIFGGAVKLSGDGEVVSGRSLPLSGDGPFSYGCWIHHEQGLPAVLLSTRNSPRRVGFDLSIERDRSLQVIIAADPPTESSDGLSGYSRTYLAVKTQSAFDSENSPAWHHVLVTYDGSQVAAGVSIYVDGKPIPAAMRNDELAGLKLTGSALSELPLYIGSRSGTYRFQGKIDDVRIFNRELTSNDVQQIYSTCLKMLAHFPAAKRTVEQQALLTGFYPSVDLTRCDMETQLAVAEAEWKACRWQPANHWYLNSQGQTMVVFDKSISPRGAHLMHSFALSSHEVTYAEYRRFLQDPGIDSAIAATDDCPAHVVSWFLAAQYCNWLNQQEGVPEDQWIFEPNGRGQYADGMTVKEQHAELTGYRLPTEAEWKYACRAGASTTYSFGEPLPLLRNYAQYIANSGGRSHPVESLLPNDAGLFDMHGNLWEWTLESAFGRLSPVGAGTTRQLCGGAYYLDSALVRPTTRTSYTPSMRITNIGFRPARTFHQPLAGLPDQFLNGAK